MGKEVKVLEKRHVLGKQFKIYGDFDNPLFLAKDVSAWLEHTDTSRMVNSIDEDEKLVRTLFVSGQRRDVLFLTEEGLYEVLFQSRKPVAKMFKKQVKHILKEIRKNGAFVVAQKLTEQWQEKRAIGKLSRKAETDVLKKLVEYAKSQGSSNADKLYMTYSSLVKKLVGGYSKRENATQAQLTALTTMEEMILHCVTDAMEVGLPYKEIYQVCKRKLQAYIELTYFERKAIL